MATDDQVPSTPSMTKRPVSRKQPFVTYVQTTGVNASSRLPSLLSKSNDCLSTPGTMRFKRYLPQSKDMSNTSSSTTKIERQTTNMSIYGRLPPLNTTSDNNNKKELSDLRRRQIYALNHLMRELEQEQFREFCKLNGIRTENSEEIVTSDEDPNKQSTTLI